ncbi:MAG: tunicamycin resistance protein [Anaerolineae bacterium]|nr:tunicamycin resistance protein [Anaerolineae bacterium]
MIIMLNGSFGVGKSSVAYALLDLLPSAMLFDPEEVGLMLRKVTFGILPDAENTDDFQDISAWPPLVVATAAELHHRYQRTLIVPMTLANPDYFAHIKSGLAQIGIPLHHFCLVAPLETVYDRLRLRGERDGSWAFRKAARYVPMFNDPLYAHHLDTTTLTAAELARHIVQSLPIT